MLSAYPLGESLVQGAGSVEARFPRVVASSVIRSTHQGDSHGGVYVVDLDTGSFDQMIDWNDDSISWEGRGGERGLRGIVLYADRIYLVASAEVFVYTQRFQLMGSFRNKYLKHCHEVCVGGDTLFLTSTGFDSILEFDLMSQSFVRGYCLRHTALQHRAMRLRKGLLGQNWAPIPNKMKIFDANEDDGPMPGDTFHINSVCFRNGVLYVAGTRLDRLLCIDGNEVLSHAKIPLGNHNARPFGEGVLLNDTRANRIAYLDTQGRTLEAFALPRYREDELLMSHLPEDHARPGFGRGLCVADNGLIVGGSSPATISIYRTGQPAPVRSVNLTMDVRNAIHGVEIWPHQLGGD